MRTYPIFEFGNNEITSSFFLILIIKCMHDFVIEQSFVYTNYLLTIVKLKQLIEKLENWLVHKNCRST